MLARTVSCSATNWPHPNLFAAQDVPDDANLANVFEGLGPRSGAAPPDLVTNPELL
jgi:hypothetical protein